MPRSGFLQELQGHHVFRVAAAYGVVGWLIIQVVAILFPVLDFPEWLERVVVVVVLAGFPVALVLAWAFQAPRDQTRPTQNTRRRSLRVGFALGLAGALIAVIAGGVWWWLVPVARSRTASKAAVAATSIRTAAANTSISAEPTLNPKSIAVLPLSALDSGTESNYLGQGISEELLNALSRIPDLEVIGRTSSFRFRDSDLGAQAIGRDLGVRNLLSGVVQRSGDDLRIDMELDDTVTGAKLWSAQYDEKMEGLFALEDRISNAVIAALQVKLGGSGNQTLVFEGTASPRAHNLLMQAARLSRHTDEAGLEQALVLFNQAIAEDPNYAAAWGGMAHAYVNLADVYRAPLDVLPAMRGAAEKAIVLDPQLAEGHLDLGYIAMSYDLDFAKARHELDLAVKLGPSLSEARALRGLYLLRVEKNAAAARAELQAARKLDPLNPWYPRWEAFVAIAQDDEAGAMKLAQRVDQIDPGFAYNGDAVAMVEGAFGHWQACVDRYRLQRARLSLSSPQLAICQARTGDAAQASAAAEELESDAQHRYVDRTYIAAIHAAVGDSDRAMEDLEQAFKDHSAHMNSVWINPWYQPLHGDPRFEALVARVSAGGKAN